MRKLGHQLGIEAMLLYHYVTNKDDLLDAILDCLYAEIELPLDVPDDDWETAVRRGLRSFHGVLVGHKAALQLFSGRPAKSPEAFNVRLWWYNRFIAVGLDERQARLALDFGVSFVMGHVASEMGTLALIRDGEVFDPDEMDDPAAAEFIRQTCDISSEEMFEAGVEAVVAGLRSAYKLP